MSSPDVLCHRLPQLNVDVDRRLNPPSRTGTLLLFRLQDETGLAFRDPGKVKRPCSNLGTLVFPDRGHHESAGVLSPW